MLKPYRLQSLRDKQEALAELSNEALKKEIKKLGADKKVAKKKSK